VSSAEYLAVGAGLIGVWSGIEQLLQAFAGQTDQTLWSLAIPL
jgi:hypothetical protein